jgi:hypothetical protein
MAPIEGETVCTYHLGEVDRAVKESMAERLRQGADEAIARLRQVVRTGADADATRASEILLSRVAPKLASSQAIVVSVGGDGGVDPRQAATEVVRARLLQLAAVSAERDQEADDAEFDDGDVIDAEIVEVDVDRWGRA